MAKTTSWGPVADWYDEYLRDANTYQAQVIAPNLLRLVAPRPGLEVLALGWGWGWGPRERARRGARVAGADLSAELVAKAAAEKSADPIRYVVTSSHQLEMFAPGSFDVVTIILALQNIAEVKETFAAVARVLRPSGRFFIVLNHPAFRIPKASSWGWDEEAVVRYRRVDEYLSERRVAIEMHPGRAPGVTTLSFHRPLQYYFKLLGAAGFGVTKVEEWVSHRRSEPGPRAQAEDKARHEIPLFMTLEARIIKP